MKKYLLTLVIFIFGIFFLVSCDDKSSNNNNKPSESQESSTNPTNKDENNNSQDSQTNPSKDNDGESQQTTPQEDVYFNVVFKDYDGTILDTQSVKEGTTPTYNKSNPLRSNDENYKYEFTGWSPEITAVTSDSTYIAQYNKIPYSNYTITFKNYDGTVLQESQVKEGTIPTYNKSNPTRPNDENYKYEFYGWSPEITVVASNITYIAQYNRIELPYTISFDLDNGTSTSGISTIKIETLTKDKFKFDITKPKYIFRGWEYNGTQVFDENGNIINNITLQSNMTFKAIFEESITLTITYSIYNPKDNLLIGTYNTKPNDLGSVSETRSYHWNTPVNLFANPNEGYTFIGWYYNGIALSNENNYNYMMWEDDITIEAKFEYTQYDLNVWSNNTDLGQVMIRNGYSQVWYDDQTQKQYYTESTTIAAYTKTDTRFLGWYDENNNLVSTSAVYAFTMLNRDYTLEAKWNLFNITYDLDGGTNNVNNPTSYNKDMGNIQLLNPIKDGYTFMGWEYKGNIITEINTVNLCYMELKAKWSVNINTSYKVEHYLQNLDDDNYPDTPYEVDNLIGTTDTLTNGEVNIYEGFTSPEITQVNINGDGSTVIELYYVRKKFEVTSNNLNAGNIIGCGSYKYGKNVTIQITPHLGYAYDGLYVDDSLITSDLIYEIYNISSNYNLEFRLSIISELSNFTFASTVDNLTITGVKDKTVTNIVLPNIVTNISLGAFSGCSTLESITLPFIGDKRHTSTDKYQYPFGYIFGTSSYTGNTSTRQYYYGSSTTSTESTTYFIPSKLKEVIITDCEYIQYGAFYKCYKLSNITIPNSVTSIGNYAFYYCSSLTSIEIPACITSIGESVFEGCSSLTSITIPNSVTSIGYEAFYECSSLTNIAIGNSVTSIGARAFYKCSKLTSITIPNSVTSIGNYAFYHCSSLTSIEIPACITSIGESVFEGCMSLTSITIPNSVKSIEEYAFYACHRLVEVINESSLSITLGSNSNGYIGYYAKQIIIDKSNSKLSTDSNGFVTYNDGTNIWLVNYIRNSTEVVIPNNVTKINKYAFYNCTSLISITIPNSVISIGSYAFYNCTSLTNVYYLGTVDDWDSITINSDGNSYLTNATRYYYSEEEPLDSGNYWHYDIDGKIKIWE